MTSTTEMPKRRTDAEAQEPTVTISIRFPESLRTRALAVGKAEDRTFASLVIYALRRYVNEAEKRDA